MSKEHNSRTRRGLYTERKILNQWKKTSAPNNLTIFHSMSFLVNLRRDINMSYRYIIILRLINVLRIFELNDYDDN